MTSQRKVRPRANEKGVAVLLFVLILLVGVGGWLVSGLSSAKLELDRDRQIREALAEAKEALIGYAASDANRPGELPCPDVNNDGETLPSTSAPNHDQNSDLTCVNLVGRLPYKRLRLPDLRESGGELLWYALSDNFHAGVATPINSDVVGQLTVNGPSPAAGVVAIIFAPGAAINAQSRSAANINDVTHYLDGENAVAPLTTFSSGPLNAAFNDRIITISADDLFAVVEKRVLKEVESALNDYFVTGSNIFPPPASFADASCLGTAPTASCTSDPSVDGGRIPANPVPSWTPGAAILQGTASSWFHKNGWREVIYYAPAYTCTNPVLTNCLYCTVYFLLDPRCGGAASGGYVTLDVPPGAPLATQKVVLVAAGKAIGTQVRINAADKANPGNYVESENADLDSTYLKADLSSTFHDRPIAIP
jgi:hypothetical protein